NGYYCFLDLPPGEYTICVDPNDLPSDAKLAETTYPSDGPNCQKVPLGTSNINDAHFFFERCGEGPPPCTVQGSINSNFNGTAVVGASSGPAYIWFNSNFSLKNVPAGTHVMLTNSHVTING